MGDADRRMKANRIMAGEQCRWCELPIALGADVAVCGACTRPHHSVCWDQRQGCSREGCENAPLEQLAPAMAVAPVAAVAAAPVSAPAAQNAPQAAHTAAAVPLGKRACPHCGKLTSTRQPLCRYCNLAPTRDGVYRGPRTTAPGATAALVFGILSLAVCGLLGIFAIVRGNEAVNTIRRDPSYGGKGMAVTGVVLGWIALVILALVILSAVISS